MLFAILHFIFLGASFHLDKKLKEGHIPPNGKMCFFIFKQIVISFFLYRLLMPPKNYKYVVAKNKNECIAIFYIKTFNVLSIVSVLVCLFFIIIICFMN